MITSFTCTEAKRGKVPAVVHADATLRPQTVKHQVNPPDAIWLDTVAADGSPKSTAKAHNWKANYHDVRAIVKFVEAFGGGFEQGGS